MRAPIPFVKVALTGATMADTKLALMWGGTKDAFRVGNGKSQRLVLRGSTRACVRGEDRKVLSDDAAPSGASWLEYPKAGADRRRMSKGPSSSCIPM